MVLLDKGLPDGNGAALIPEVRGRFLESAIVIVTGDEDFNAVGKCLAMGADDYLVKSESFVEDLLIRIPVVLKNREAMRIARSAPKSPALKIPLQVTDLTVDSLEQFMRAAEKEYLQAALALLNGDLQETAKTLGLARSTLFKKVADHEIGRPSVPSVVGRRSGATCLSRSKRAYCAGSESTDIYRSRSTSPTPAISVVRIAIILTIEMKVLSLSDWVRILDDYDQMTARLGTALRSRSAEANRLRARCSNLCSSKLKALPDATAFRS